MQRVCLDCGEPLSGRSDKKFCSDNCRNHYNNRLNSDTTNLMRNVNNALRKNRRILMELNPEGKITVHRERMLERGFQFEFMTSSYTTRKGATYIYCYEQGYLPLENDFYMLIRKKSGEEAFMV